MHAPQRSKKSRGGWDGVWHTCSGGGNSSEDEKQTDRPTDRREDEKNIIKRIKIKVFVCVGLWALVCAAEDPTGRRGEKEFVLIFFFVHR